MRTLVTYMSSTGNTRKVAEAIYGEIPGEKEIMALGEVGDASGYGLVFMGFPTHQFGPDKKALEAMGRHCVGGRKVALFVTHAAPEDAPDLPEWMAKFKDAASAADLVGFFDCQGQMSKGVKAVLRLSPNKKLRSWVKMDNSQGQPDETRLRRAREFAREVVGKVGPSP